MKKVSVLLLISISAISIKLCAKTDLAAAYDQCGGIDWTGPTECVSPYVCTVANDYYSQCLPGPETTQTAKAKNALSAKAKKIHK